MEINQKKALLYGLIAVFLWSTVASAFKLSLRYLDTIQLLLYASFFSLILLSLVIIYQKKITLIFSYSFKEYLFLGILGVINPFFYYLVLFKAYDLLPAQEVQPLNYTWALTLSYLSVLILKHSLKKEDILGGIVSYFGVMIISTHGNLLNFSFTNSQGVFLALFSTLLWSLYWLYNAKLNVDPIVGLFINFLSAFPLILIWSFLFSNPFEVSWYGILGASYVGLFEMGITFILWLKAIKMSTNASKIANLIFISPFISLGLISIFVGEIIQTSTLVGLIFIIMGLFIQQRSKIPVFKE